MERCYYTEGDGVTLPRCRLIWVCVDCIDCNVHVLHTPQTCACVCHVKG